MDALSLTPSTDCQPGTKISLLRQRAQIMAVIRAFFHERDVLEVQTPHLGQAPASDPYLSALTVIDSTGKRRYLQTSPEYAMKRLLVLGSGSVYQLDKAFRDDEHGRLHQCEFTLLEWYRLGFNEHKLMSEIDDLLRLILNTNKAVRLSYAEVFLDHFKINPHCVDSNILKTLVKQHCGDIVGLDHPSKDDLLNVLFSRVIEPALGHETPCFIYDYPASQAALAKLKCVDGSEVAARFELFYKGIELANGYHELQDVEVHRQRFSQDLLIRKQHNLPIVPLDDAFMQALESGLPDCAGVALGVDRLVMLALKQATIQAVMV